MLRYLVCKSHQCSASKLPLALTIALNCAGELWFSWLGSSCRCHPQVDIKFLLRCCSFRELCTGTSKQTLGCLCPWSWYPAYLAHCCYRMYCILYWASITSVGLVCMIFMDPGIWNCIYLLVNLKLSGISIKNKRSGNT